MKDVILKGYKVVSNNLKSPYADFYGGEVKYKIGKKTKPKKGNGPLSVFTELESTLHFRGVDERVFKCIYKKSESNSLWTIEKGIRRSRDCFFPDNTDFADWVELTEEINVTN
jgi:hypothetical protein